MIILGTVASSIISKAITYEIISSVTLTSAASSVTFTGIPSTYTHLEVRASARSTRGNHLDDLYVMFNNTSATHSSTNLTGRIIYHDGGQNTAGYINSSNGYYQVGFINAATSVADSFGAARMMIMNYAKNGFKSWNAEASEPNTNTSQMGQAIGGGLWSDTSAITSIKFINPNGNYATSSTFSLYGIKD